MNPKKCIILLFDGARHDVFANLLKAGKLPNIHRHIVSEGSFLKGYSCLISTTGPAHIPFLYGIFPGTANVPGIRWFDKTSLNGNRGRGSGKRSYVGPGCFSMGKDVAEGYTPLYNYFSSPRNVFSSLNKRHSIKVGTNDLQKIIYFAYAHYTRKWDVVDYRALKSTNKSLVSGSDFVFSVFPGIDEISHLNDPEHAKVLNQYKVLDGYVGNIFENLTASEKKDTIFFIVSDHGLSKTHTHVPLVNICRDEGFSPLYYPKIFKKRYDLAILESGNAGAFIYFMNPVKERPAFYNEIISEARNRRLINRLINQNGIDFIAYRQDESSIGVRNKEGTITVEYSDNTEVALKCSGQNPLGFDSRLKSIPAIRSLDLTRNTDYPDSIVQLIQLFHSKRTGDIAVFAKEGYDLREKHEWPEHSSSHGTLMRSHMEVPVCTNIRLGSSSCRTVDVFPTILDRLGYTVPDYTNGNILH